MQLNPQPWNSAVRPEPEPGWGRTSTFERRPGARYARHRNDWVSLAAGMATRTLFVRSKARSQEQSEKQSEKLGPEGRKVATSGNRSTPETSGSSSNKSGNKWIYLLQRLFTDMGKAAEGRRRDSTYWAILAGSAVLAIFGDLFGIMRALLSLNPEGARQANMDEIYPVNGLKAFRQRGRYHLRYPGDWLGDESVAFSKQAAAETPTLRQRKRIIPDAAFGPAGAGIAPVDRAQSLSVIVQPVPSESLQLLLGDPENAFVRLSKETFTATQFGQSTELLSTEQDGEKYCFQYLVNVETKKGPVCIHCWSTVALRNSERSRSELYTMTLVVPEQMLTSENRQIFDQVWHSFELE